MPGHRDETSDDAPDPATLRLHFSEFGRSAASRAPLYAALSLIAGDSPLAASVLGAAPPMQRRPVLLFAAVHRVLFDHADDPLAAWYPNLAPDARAPDHDLEAAFVGFLEAHEERMRTIVATRSTQTNEIGRCATLLPGLARIAAETGGPLALIDVGTSGGLNLLIDSYAYRYTFDAGAPTLDVGGPSPVTVPVSVRGAMPRPHAVPTIAARVGLDRQPLDVTVTDDARWLQACVWPDQTDRFERLTAAIDLFRQVRPPIVRGDAVDDLAATVGRVASAGHPVVTNTWVLNYLTPDRRADYLAALDTLGAEIDISWLWAEAPALVPELPTEADPRDPHLTVLTLVRWRGGRRIVEPLATCHPHGYWIHWR